MSAWPFGYPPGSNRSMSSTYFKTCSSHAACRRTSVLITAPGSSPRRCGIGSALSAQRPPTSARGRTGTSKALMRGSAASFSMARSSTPCARPRSSSESWRRHYNRVRQHASIGYRAPAPEVFVPALAASPAAQSRPAPPAVLPLVPRSTLN